MDFPQPFSPPYRDCLASTVLKWASADDRVVAGAIVGLMATGPGDRWSDLDLSFGIANGIPVVHVLEDWTAKLKIEFAAAKTFRSACRAVYLSRISLAGLPSVRSVLFTRR